MTDAPVTPETLDIGDWLSGLVNAESTITVYRDGTRLYQLEELSRLAADAAEQAKNANNAGLSIADEYDETASEAIAAAEKVRAELAPSGLTFHLRSIGTEGRDALLKKLEREPRFKAVPKTGDTEAIPGGQQHPDYFEAYQHELTSRAIIKVEDANGRGNAEPWTPEKVAGLRRLPLNEFNRLWNKVYDLHYKNYDIERMVDLDFSSRL